MYVVLWTVIQLSNYFLNQVFCLQFLTQLTMSAEAFSITLCPSVFTPIYPSITRFFEIFDKVVIYIYNSCKMQLLRFSFNRFKIMQGSFAGYKHYGLGFLYDRTIFEFLANFQFHWNNGLIYGYYKCISTYSFYSIVLISYRALLLNITITVLCFLAMLTMSAKAFSIILCPSSVYQSVCPFIYLAVSPFVC